jgi:hypothetical protein
MVDHVNKIRRVACPVAGMNANGGLPMTIYLLVGLLLAALIVAFFVRATWAFSLPGLLLILLILWLLFST